MSNSPEKYPPSDRASTLGRWIHRTIELQGLRVKYRLRGNSLHILCEGSTCPNRMNVLLWFLPALKDINLNALIPADSPQIYQVQLYGCKVGQNYPDWTAAIYLNQLDRHLEQLKRVCQTPEALLSNASQHGASLLKNERFKAEKFKTEKLKTEKLKTEKLKTEKPPATLPNFNANRNSDLDSDANFDPNFDPVKTAATERSALALSNRSLAKRGQELAIASYLSETLSGFGVAVRVSVKTIPYHAHTTVRLGTPTPVLTTKRLWVACEATYSPDPTLLGEPITQKLRSLEIEGYRDAVILFQVVGEARPDWMLRVDLTPPGEMLREWARWGDVEAIQRLLNQALINLKLQVSTASLKESTLHLFCGVLPENLFPGAAKPATKLTADLAADLAVNPAANLSPQSSAVPNQQQLRAMVADQMEMLGPQGIHSATIYGQVAEQETPAWVEWLELPAAVHPALAEPALTLAQKGDWQAIAFLLHRLLNPGLDKYLATGGIRLQLLPKQDLLHIMSEAPLCPDQHSVGSSIARFLQQLQLPGVSGVRVYGRRAGQKHPLWSYGDDFTARDRLVPEATPEFAATDAFIGDLISHPGESVIRPDLTPEDIQTAWNQGIERIIRTIQQFLLRSRLFAPEQNPERLAIALPGQVCYQGIKEAIVWGTAGVLLTLQANWMLGYLLQLKSAQPSITTKLAPAGSTVASSTPPAAVASSTLPITSDSTAAGSPAPAKPNLTLKRSPNTDPNAFNPQGFTAPDPVKSQPGSPPKKSASEPLPYTAPNPEAIAAAVATQAAHSPLPTFNSRQLDNKLKLYYRFLEESGGPPDVLILGSSRALRGVDPIALKQGLAKLGYPNAKIFNFGINGATAQVVDLIVQHLLTPEQLPHLIIWADGARAFNSGAVDITYNGIVASEAYQQLAQGKLLLPNPTAARSTAAAKQAASPQIVQQTGINTSLTSSYQALDRWFSQQLATASGTYPERDRLKHLVQQGLTFFLPSAKVAAAATATDDPRSPNPTGLPFDETLMDANGFLSLAVQFNPATYYQKFAKVSGDYDSDYQDFRIPGRQDSALKSLLQFTQARSIPVVFVNLPLTEDYLDPDRSDHEQEFEKYMVSLTMNRQGLIFRNMSDLWTTNYDYFSDPSHLNRYGAYAISNSLAQDPLIPWSEGKLKKAN